MDYITGRSQVDFRSMECLIKAVPDGTHWPTLASGQGHGQTDVCDAERIAELLQYGLLRASFVPPQGQRELRELTRAHHVRAGGGSCSASMHQVDEQVVQHGSQSTVEQIGFRDMIGKAQH